MDRKIWIITIAGSLTARDQDVLNQGATIRPQQQIKQDLYYRALDEKGGTVAELSKAVL